MKKMLLFVVMLFPFVMGANDLANYTHEGLTLIKPNKFNKTQTYYYEKVKTGEDILPRIVRVINPLNNGLDYYYVKLGFSAITYSETNIIFSEFELTKICETIKKMREEAQKDLEIAKLACENKEPFNMKNQCVLSNLVYLEYRVLKDNYTGKADVDWYLFSAQDGVIEIGLKDKFDILQFFEHYIAEIQNLKIKNSAQ